MRSPRLLDATVELLILGRDRMKDPSLGYARIAYMQGDDLMPRIDELGIQNALSADAYLRAGAAANMAKYAAGEDACAAADRTVQAHGGNGSTTEYGVAGRLVASRVTRIAPVSREMILNFVGSHTLGRPKSY